MASIDSEQWCCLVGKVKRLKRRFTDAIICSNKMMAGGVLRYLAEASRKFSRQQLSLEQVPMKGTP